VISVSEAAVTGVIAGFGVAVPLGAIGVLLIRLGLKAGFRAAVAGGLGVATVDLAYCSLAVCAGSQVSQTISGWGNWPLYISGTVLVGIGLSQLAGAFRDNSGAAAPLKARSQFLRFVGLTALNPMTVVYFAALATVLASRQADVVGRTVFVVGVGSASAAWQILLAAAGALLHKTARPRAMRLLGVTGSAIVVSLGLAVIARGVWPG